MELEGFSQLITGITRSWPGQGDSAIDHFWTNNSDRVLSCSNEVRAVGDHNYISATICLKGQDSRRLETRTRDYKKFDQKEFNTQLAATDWEQIYEIDDVNVANDFVESRMTELLDKMCPYRAKQFRKHSKPWVSSDTKAEMTERDSAREKARHTDLPADWKTYRELRNRVNTNLDKDRKNHFKQKYEKHLEDNDTAAVYNTAKQQSGWKSVSTPVSFQLDGTNITAPQMMADIQMNTFENKTNKLLSQLPAQTEDPTTSLRAALEKWGVNKSRREVFSFKEMTKAETLKTIQSLKNNTSMAHNRICALAVKAGAASLHGPITHLVNLSIRSSTFPARWKIGLLLPLHKGKGLDRRDPASYRPISLLPILRKITERMLQPQIMDFMTNSLQLNLNHHSYRKGHSTTTTLLQLSDAVFEGCNMNKSTTLVTVDQSSAFDVISHATLLDKLKLYNWGTAAVNWIKSYLSSRSDYVQIGTRSSRYRSVQHGVPQGSVLGPILYVVYTNELPDLLNESTCQNPVHSQDHALFNDNCNDCGTIPTYADDSTLVITTDTRFQAQEKITTKMEKVKSFLNNNSLTVNGTKTEILEMMVQQKLRWVRGTPPPS